MNIDDSGIHGWRIGNHVGDGDRQLATLLNLILGRDIPDGFRQSYLFTYPKPEEFRLGRRY